MAILANPVSGFGRAVSLAKETGRVLEDRGAQVEILFTEKQGDGAVKAKGCSGRCEAVVGVGGDGTLNEVANGLRDSGTPLALLPTGTANVLAKEFGLSPAPEDVASTVLGGTTVDMDAGRWRDRLFLCVAGVGFDAAVAASYAGRRKGTGSYKNYVIPVLSTLARYDFPKVVVEPDTGPPLVSAGWALVTNTKSFGGPFWFCDHADPLDGELDAVVIGRGGMTGVSRYMMLAMLRRFSSARDTHSAKGRSFNVYPDSGELPVQLDGDLAGICSRKEPARFEVVPSAV
ncbi:MAG: diacylglycerol/lipid kinase family protein, partial [Planctomycetota bacterium]